MAPAENRLTREYVMNLHSKIILRCLTAQMGGRLLAINNAINKNDISPDELDLCMFCFLSLGFSFC